MFAPISIEDFADATMKNNKGYNRKDLIRTLEETLKAKNNGAKCVICGSAITGTYMCFTCTTGEADDSEDYEIV